MGITVPDDALEQVVESFLARFRAGERPSIEERARRERSYAVGSGDSSADRSRSASGAKSAPLGQQTLPHTGSSIISAKYAG